MEVILLSRQRNLEGKWLLMTLANSHRLKHVLSRLSSCASNFKPRSNVNAGAQYFNTYPFSQKWPLVPLRVEPDYRLRAYVIYISVLTYLLNSAISGETIPTFTCTMRLHQFLCMKYLQYYQCDIFSSSQLIRTVSRDKTIEKPSSCKGFLCVPTQVI